MQRGCLTTLIFADGNVSGNQCRAHVGGNSICFADACDDAPEAEGKIVAGSN